MLPGDCGRGGPSLMEAQNFMTPGIISAVHPAGLSRHGTATKLSKYRVQTVRAHDAQNGYARHHQSCIPH